MASILEMDRIFSPEEAQRQLLLLFVILKKDIEDGRYRQILRSIIDLPVLEGVHVVKIMAYIALQEEPISVGHALHTLRLEGHLKKENT